MEAQKLETEVSPPTLVAWSVGSPELLDARAALANYYLRELWGQIQEKVEFQQTLCSACASGGGTRRRLRRFAHLAAPQRTSALCYSLTPGSLSSSSSSCPFPTHPRQRRGTVPHYRGVLPWDRDAATNRTALNALLGRYVWAAGDQKRVEEELLLLQHEAVRALTYLRSSCDVISAAIESSLADPMAGVQMLSADARGADWVWQQHLLAARARVLEKKHLPYYERLLEKCSSLWANGKAKGWQRKRSVAAIRGVAE